MGVVYCLLKIPNIVFDMAEDPERIDYHPPATFASDLKVLKSMLFADVHGATQQERLESFYVSQVIFCNT